MRNLKKILALALALIMSLSLMVTASAKTDFDDNGDINENYAIATKVLNELGVFTGDDQDGDGKLEFRPTSNITRAEVAIILYRIFTGDVEYPGKSGTYASSGVFSDVTAENWYSGYVTYAYQANLIKGYVDINGNRVANPNGNVTGFEVLAMILRAVGYDKAENEYTGPDWQVHVADRAQREGVLDNILKGDVSLSAPATREEVAEMVFRSILLPKVSYNIVTKDYDKSSKDDTIASTSPHKLLEVEGEVIANEFADLEGTSTMAEGKARVRSADGKSYTFNGITSENALDDIGLVKYAYVQPVNNSTVNYTVVGGELYEKEGANTVYDDGAEITVAKAADSKGLSVNSTTRHYINYDESDARTAKIVIRYSINLTEANNRKLITDTQYVQYIAASGTRTWLEAKNNSDRSTMTGKGTADEPYVYTKEIRVEESVTSLDYTLINAIFYGANDATTGTKVKVGEVYVGTQSADDVSDSKFYTDFWSTYTNQTKSTISSNPLGYRLIIIDNDKDGVANYVLQTRYTIAKVYTKNAAGDLTLDAVAMNALSDEYHADHVNAVVTGTKIVSKDDLKEGDVVIYALIEGIARADLADTVTAKIDKVDRKALTATTTDGTTYDESAVHAHAIGLGDGVTGLAGNTTYDLYFDYYGNLAAYTESTLGNLVLMIDGWYNETKGGTEYAVRTWSDGSRTVNEVDSTGSLFISKTQNTQNNSWNSLTPINPINTKNDGRVSNDVTTNMAFLDGKVLTPVEQASHYRSNYRMISTGKNVPLRDNNVTGTVYTTEVLGKNAYNTAAAGTYNVYGTASTVYYVVYNLTINNNPNNVITVVRQYTGYNSVPTSIATNTTANEHIEDVYAVGTVSTNADGKTYYAAAAVVIEMDNGYNKAVGEQVFIPEFRTAVNNVRKEEVELIRGNGLLDTVTIDLFKSEIRNYNPAEGLGHTNGGLYYMEESDSEADVYVVIPMDLDRIREAYMIGYVYGTENVANYDYAVIETVKTDGTAYNAVKPTARNVSTSQYYTLGYDYTDGYANLEKSVYRNVITTDTAESIARPVTVDLCTEKYNETSKGGNWKNEVLVAVESNSSTNGYDIIYAISFNEFSRMTNTTHKHDLAQEIWYSYLPVATDVPGPGPGDDTNKRNVIVTNDLTSNTVQFTLIASSDNEFSAQIKAAGTYPIPKDADTLDFIVNDNNGAVEIDISVNGSTTVLPPAAGSDTNVTLYKAAIPTTGDVTVRLADKGTISGGSGDNNNDNDNAAGKSFEEYFDEQYPDKMTWPEGADKGDMSTYDDATEGFEWTNPDTNEKVTGNFGKVFQAIVDWATAKAEADANKSSKAARAVRADVEDGVKVNVVTGPVKQNPDTKQLYVVLTISVTITRNGNSITTDPWEKIVILGGGGSTGGDDTPKDPTKPDIDPTKPDIDPPVDDDTNDIIQAVGNGARNGFAVTWYSSDIYQINPDWKDLVAALMDSSKLKDEALTEEPTLVYPANTTAEKWWATHEYGTSGTVLDPNDPDKVVKVTVGSGDSQKTYTIALYRQFKVSFVEPDGTEATYAYGSDGASINVTKVPQGAWIKKNATSGDLDSQSGAFVATLGGIITNPNGSTVRALGEKGDQVFVRAVKIATSGNATPGGITLYDEKTEGSKGASVVNLYVPDGTEIYVTYGDITGTLKQTYAYQVTANVYNKNETLDGTTPLMDARGLKGTETTEFAEHVTVDASKVTKDYTLEINVESGWYITINGKGVSTVSGGKANVLQMVDEAKNAKLIPYSNTLTVNDQTITVNGTYVVPVTNNDNTTPIYQSATPGNGYFFTSTVTPKVNSSTKENVSVALAASDKVSNGDITTGDCLARYAEDGVLKLVSAVRFLGEASNQDIVAITYDQDGVSREATLPDGGVDATNGVLFPIHAALYAYDRSYKAGVPVKEDLKGFNDKAKSDESINRGLPLYQGSKIVVEDSNGDEMAIDENLASFNTAAIKGWDIPDPSVTEETTLTIKTYIRIANFVLGTWNVTSDDNTRSNTASTATDGVVYTIATIEGIATPDMITVDREGADPGAVRGVLNAGAHYTYHMTIDILDGLYFCTDKDHEPVAWFTIADESKQFDGAGNLHKEITTNDDGKLLVIVTFTAIE